MRGRDLGLLLLLAAMWGSSYLYMRVAAPALGPVVVAGLRVSLAGAALLAYAAAVRRMPTLRPRWKSYLLMGLLNGAIPYTSLNTAELHLTAGLTAILNATTPLFAAPLAAIWLHDRLTAKKVLGLLCGILGVVVLTGWGPLPLDTVMLVSVGFCLLASLSYAFAGVYAKRALAGEAPLAQATGQQLGATAILLPVTLPVAVVTAPAIYPSPAAVFCVAALAFLSTAAAYIIYFRLLADVGPTKTLSVTFLLPAFALLWSAIFLGEDVQPQVLAGLAIILLSVFLVTEVRVPLLKSLAATRKNHRENPLEVVQ